MSVIYENLTWLYVASPGNRTWQWTIPICNDIFPLRYVRVFLYNPILVGGFSSSEKYESQLGWWHFQYMESHNPVMFQSPPTSIKTTSELQNLDQIFPMKTRGLRNSKPGILENPQNSRASAFRSMAWKAWGQLRADKKVDNCRSGNHD